MKILQLIDSLRPGGAERMAVAYANALVGKVEKSCLCCTRMEGGLQQDLCAEVAYLFLNKKSRLDRKAFGSLRKFVKAEKITHIHAHSSSFFMASLLKLSGLKFKLIWHDHYGESDFLEQRQFRFLQLFSFFFDGIIVVNHALKKWALQNLRSKRVVKINNFVPFRACSKSSTLQLKGQKEDFKLICIANLRPQKDHHNLLNAFDLLSEKEKISLHLVGAAGKDDYSQQILRHLEKDQYRHRVFYYGVQHAILDLLQQANLGVLSSRSEGLPVALLEYGAAGLPVVCTRVGQCEEVVGNCGKVVPANNPQALSAAIAYYLQHPEKAKQDGLAFKEKVKREYSEVVIIQSLLDFYKKA